MADIVAYPVLYGQRHVVLIVESDARRAALVCGRLKESGFHAVSVAGTEQAAAMITLGVTVDIVVSDVGLQGGLSLARWVMEHRPDLPLILASEGARVSKMKLCGAELLEKPYAEKWLAEKIRDCLLRNCFRPVMKPKRRVGSALLLPFGGR